MIANARMYSVSWEAAELWHALLTAVAKRAGIELQIIEHPAPAPLETLWAREDMAAVFMCGLPFSRAAPKPKLIAAPVPSLPEFNGEAHYWSAFVVRRDAPFDKLADTFGGRLALTVEGSQSGYVAALSHLQQIVETVGGAEPVYARLVTPTISPLGSLNAVVDGEADVAPIDAYALALLQRFRRDLTDQVRTLECTRPTPIPPLVASTGAGLVLRPALLEAHRHADTAALMQQLLLARFVAPDPADYDILRQRDDEAREFWSTHRLA